MTVCTTLLFVVFCKFVKFLPDFEFGGYMIEKMQFIQAALMHIFSELKWLAAP